MNALKKRFATAATSLVAGAVIVMAAWPVASADKTSFLKPAWRVEGKHDMGRIAVGMDGNVVYARDEDTLTALNTTDGSQRYQIELTGFEEKGYWGHVDDTTYVYTTNKEVVGIDLDSGKERWRKSPGDGFKTSAWREPRVGHPKAMLLAFENGVSVWDIAPGRLLWSAKERLNEDLNPNTWADENDPETGVLMFLYKRTVLVGPSGKELWSADDKGNDQRGEKNTLMPSAYAYGRLLLIYLSKQVVLVNSVTGEVLASQAFSSAQAAADVEAFQLNQGGSEASANAPLVVTLGGRLVIADPKQGKVLAKTPENSIVGQAAGGTVAGGEIVVLTAMRGGEKTADTGLHLYRVNPATGDVKWHAQNGQQVGTGNVMSNIVWEHVNGPYFLDKTKGVLLATSDAGVRLYDWQDGKERWTVNKDGKERWAGNRDLPNSYVVTKMLGGNSFAMIRTMMKNRFYVPTNPTPAEADGVVYVAGSDKVFAIDAASGKVNWESKSSSLGLVSGLEVGDGAVIVKQGLYADVNGYGAPASAISRLLGPSFVVEEPEVYIEEDPFGFVGLDAATGRETWKCLEFEAHDREMRGPMPKDASICKVPKVTKEKSCKLGKLDIGKIVYSYSTPNGMVYVGKDGIAGAPPGTCTASWKVTGEIKNQTKIYEVAAGGERYGSGFIQHDDPAYLITHYEHDVNVVDLAAGKIIIATNGADSVKVKWSKKTLFVAEGDKVAMYQLP